MTRSGRFFLILCTGCAVAGGLLWAGSTGRLGGGHRGIALVSWNAQNLFDAEFQGTEYPDFRPEEGGSSADGWSEELYGERLRRAARVLLGVCPGGADVVLLQEVENRGVLDRLNRQRLGGRYPFRYCRRAPGSAVQTACLSRLPAEEVHYHRVEVPAGAFALEVDVSGGAPQRYIQELHFVLTGGERLVVFNNHWKSRRGGAEETEVYRRLAGGLIRRRVEALKGRRGAAGTGWSWLAAGDLNTSLEELLAPGHPIGRIRGIGGTGTGTGRGGVLSCWSMAADGRGSYVYREEWERIDHFLLSPDLGRPGGWKAEDFSVCRGGPWADRWGRPIPWRTYRQEGWSDHLPLLLVLTRQD